MRLRTLDRILCPFGCPAQPLLSVITCNRPTGLVLSAALVVHACIYYFVEKAGNPKSFILAEDSVDRPRLRRVSEGSLMDLLPSFASLPTRKRCVCLPGSEDVDGLSHSIGTVLDTIQSTEQNPTTYAGRIMKFGLAFLVFFAINLWASNLTTSLVSSSFLSGRTRG